MHGSGSRARMGDLKHIGSARQLSPPRHSASVAALHSSASALHLASSVSLSLRPVPSSASMVSAAPSPSSSRAQFKSLAVACEIRLKECIERSRVADRLLRAPPATTSADSSPADHRSAIESLIDRSISALAIVLFDILHQIKDSFPSHTLYLQFLSVLDQMVWSSQTRLVTIEQPATLASSPSAAQLSHGASTASLHPSSTPVTVVERLTNYELNLLHARNDESWRSNFQAVSEREAALQAQVDALLRENEALKRDKSTLAQETTSAQDHVRELERVVQSLDGRLRIAQEQHESVCAQMNALQRLSSEQQEVILHSRQDLLAARRALEISQASWSANETQDALRAELKKSELTVAKLEDQVSSINKLYYGMLATAHVSIQKKESVSAELVRAETKIQELSQSREEILRPYTPRPEWNKIYRAHICELTPTLLLESKSPTTTQISSLLSHLLAKDEDLARLHDTLGQTLDVQGVLKKDLARSKRDLEIAIRQNIVAQNRIRAAGLPGASGDDPADLGARISISSLYMKPKSNARFFTGAGVGKEVPAFLRSAGKIRNRHLSKKDTEMVVREVWQRKQQHDRERGRLDMNLADFFYFYLKNKYGLPTLVAEWGYNMLDSLERYRWDADCELFLKILLGEVVEEAYYDQQLLMATLTNLFQALEIIRAERRVTNLTPGSKVDALPMDYIARVLRLLFPAKTEEAFEAICASLQTCFTDSPASASDYSLLFRENRSMSETGFIEEIRDQHLYEIENLCIQLTEEIVLLPRVEGNDSDDDEAAAAATTRGLDEKKEGRVRLFDVHNAWLKLDPQITLETMDLHIARALRLAPGSVVDPTTLVKPSDFCHALFSQGLITYTSNFDSTAPQRLGSIPLPDLLVQPPQGLNTLLTSGAHSRGGKSVDRKSSSSLGFPSIDRKASSLSLSGSLDRKGTLTAASAAVAALAATSSIASVAEEDESKQQVASTGDTVASPLSQTLPPPSSSATAATSNSPSSSLFPVVGPKKDCLLSTPKILRLRPRFGLDPVVSDILFLDRGPGFTDPASLVRAPNKSNTEVETLLAEKAELDAQRFGERVRLMRDKENSMKAIQGIGVLKRRGSSVGGKILMAASAALNAAPAAAAEEKSAITVSIAPSSAGQDGVVMLPSNSSDTTPQPSPRSNRSSLASSSSLPSVEGGVTSSNNGRPPLHSPSSSPGSSTLLSPSAPVASALTPTSPLSPPPTYRSSFFAAPSVLQSPDSGVLVVQMGAGGSQGSLHAKSAASFKRRYTDRSNKSAAAVAAAVEQQQLEQRRAEQLASISPTRASRRRSLDVPLLPPSPAEATTTATAGSTDTSAAATAVPIASSDS